MTVIEKLEKARNTAVDVGVYAPLGAYDKVRDRLTGIDRKDIRKLYKDLVRRGEKRVSPVEDAIASRRKDVSGVAQGAAGRVRKTGATTRARGRAASAAVAPKLPRVAAPKKASDLPIKGYNSLTAEEIVAQSRGFTQTDLAKIYKFEQAHEARSTVLEGIEGQFVDLPIPTYDALTVEELNDRMTGLSDSELRTLRTYEKNTRARTTVLDRIETLL